MLLRDPVIPVIAETDAESWDMDRRTRPGWTAERVVGYA
jgi:hypothetical protein